jgi:hypothetical protein
MVKFSCVVSASKLPIQYRTDSVVSLHPADPR